MPPLRRISPLKITIRSLVSGPELDELNEQPWLCSLCLPKSRDRAAKRHDDWGLPALCESALPLFEEGDDDMIDFGAAEPNLNATQIRPGADQILD